MGATPFSQVLAETAEALTRRGPVAGARCGGRMCFDLATLSVGKELYAPSAGAQSGYLDDSSSGARFNKSASMIEAVRHIEAVIGSSISLSAAELRRLRREAAWSVHPDMATGPDKMLAEQLMKSVNVLVAAAMDGQLN